MIKRIGVIILITTGACLAVSCSLVSVDPPEPPDSSRMNDTTNPDEMMPGTMTPGATNPGATPGTMMPGTMTPGATNSGATPGTMMPGTMTPGATNPGATPGNDMAGMSAGFEVSINDEMIDLKWNAVEGAAKYVIYRHSTDDAATASGFASVAAGSNSEVFSYTDSDILDGQRCFYSVSAVDDQGMEIGRSAAITHHETRMRYRFTFQSNWSPETTGGTAYPSGAHYSLFLHAAHNSDYTMWAPGEIASDGVERMAETGRLATLQSEADQAEAEGNVWRTRQVSSPSPTGKTEFDIELRAEYPLFSAVTMIAPSPDWFIGAHGENLLLDTGWAAERRVDLYVYDSGTDSGPLYTSGNRDITPHEPIKRLEGNAQLGFIPPMDSSGFFMFKQIPALDDPGAPCNKLEVEASINDEMIDLRWNAVEGAAKYVIYRHPTDEAATASDLASVDVVPNSEVFSYTDSDILDGQRCFYSVSAVDDQGMEIGRSAAITHHETRMRYRFTFQSNWSPETTGGTAYPSGAHYSSFFHVAHNSDYTMWAPGEIASDGIEIMAETGGLATLRSEANQAESEGNVWKIKTASSPSPTGKRTFDLNLRAEYPLFSAVTMVAPSPDWFIGAHGENLLLDTGWAAEKRIDLYVYDSGTDSGPLYTSGNRDITPHEPIKRLEGNAQLGFIPPMDSIGFFMFEQIPALDDPGAPCDR